MGKSTVNGNFSTAMLVYLSMYIFISISTSTSISISISTCISISIHIYIYIYLCSPKAPNLSQPPPTSHSLALLPLRASIPGRRCRRCRCFELLVGMHMDYMILHSDIMLWKIKTTCSAMIPSFQKYGNPEMPIFLGQTINDY